MIGTADKSMLAGLVKVMNKSCIAEITSLGSFHKYKTYRERSCLGFLQFAPVYLSLMVGHIETGYRTASVFEIDMLVEVLGIDYNALFARD